MNKIASARELQHEISSLLTYARTYRPSRARLAVALNELADRVAVTSIIVLDEEDLEALDDTERKTWKGYTYKMTYETWDEGAVEAGETDDKGWEERGSDSFDTLEDLLREMGDKCSWAEWSSSSPNSTHDWISGESDQDHRTGERTNYHVWVQRKDGKPLSSAEMRFVNEKLGIR